MTADSIRKGFSDLKSDQELIPLSNAAKCTNLAFSASQRSAQSQPRPQPTWQSQQQRQPEPRPEPEPAPAQGQSKEDAAAAALRATAPLFDDAERADVGKCYAKKGRDEAMRLGLAKLRKKGIKGNWAVDAGAKAIVAYEEAFRQIQSATGMTDIDDLVTSFIAAEDQNFSLFNFVNELNQETEKLEDSASELRGEIDKFEGADSVADANADSDTNSVADSIAVAAS